MKLFVFAALLAVGCGSSGSKSDMGGDGGSMMQMCSSDGKSVSLNGRYAVRANLLVNVKVTRAARARRASSTTTRTRSCCSSPI